MSDACKCVDGHRIDCSTLLQYRFPPPPEDPICRYQDKLKRFLRDAFLRVAVFSLAIYCAFLHFDYLKMRAKGRLSRWLSVPEWKVLRKDKDGHELGSIEQLYEPVEEHRRIAFKALMDRHYGAGTRNRSQPPALWGTPRESFVERRDTTQESATGVLEIPLDTDPETLAALQKFILMYKAKMTTNTETPSEPTAIPPAQMKQPGPSRINTSSSPSPEAFSQYSIHPDSPEPSDCDSVPATTTSKARESEFPSLSQQPSRQTRPFKASAHSQGETIWITTASYEDLSNPPEPSPEDEPGVLYFHRNLEDDTIQVWLLGNKKEWSVIDQSDKIQHPTFTDRYFSVRLDGTPTWIIHSSWNSAKKRANGR